MTEFMPRAGLDAVVAKLVAPHVQQVVDQLAGKVRDLAPGTKIWRTRRDALVRKEHREAEGQEVPANLRFIVNSPPYDRDHYHVGDTQQLRQPRDPNGSPGATYNCRCQAEPDPDGLARRVSTRPVRVEGAAAAGEVISDGPRVREANDGTDGDEPTRYMQRAVHEVAAEH
jgi:hypothetical protein